MKAKIPNGTRVKVKIGHRLWKSNGKGGTIEYDMCPELKADTASVQYTYGEKSETDSKYSPGDERTYAQYALKFDKHGVRAWFNESDLIIQ